MGCEYYGYDSDITTSFPVSGKFSDDQKVVYGAVLSAFKVSRTYDHFFAAYHIERPSSKCDDP
jgi:hypothetical protein